MSPWSNPRAARRRLLWAVGVFGLAAAPALSPALTPARADITITPGPANPAYPGSEPDPWNVLGDLDLQGSSLSIDDGSVVNITGNLLTGDTTLFDSDGSPSSSTRAHSTSANR